MDSNNLYRQLREFGLHHSEIRVYLYLLEHGVSSPPHIAKGTGIARANCYHVLQQLRERGLISEQSFAGKKKYAPRDPESMLQSIARKKELVHQMIPDLRSLFAQQEHKPIIKFYDGFEEVKGIFTQTLLAHEVILGIASTKKLFSLSPRFFEQYRKRLKANGIIFRDILTNASGEESLRASKATMRGLYDVKLLPKEYQDVPTDILIWNEHIALITSAPPVFGTTISSAPLAETFRIIFDVLWKSLR